MQSANSELRVILFDLGGVLVELSGIPIMLRWMGERATQEELLKLWLASPTVRAFETGQITPREFGDRLIAEMVLPVAREQLLEEFTFWPRALFPGALDLVKRIPRHYVRATLSNTNALHWSRLVNEMELGPAFDHHFASHLTGKIKPDEEVFLYVAQKLECRPQEILFLDDNQLNVEAARRVGMQAVRVQGAKGAELALLEFGVMNHGSRDQFS